MKKINFILILFIIFVTGCEKESGFYITGSVANQLDGTPLAGASVGASHLNIISWDYGTSTFMGSIYTDDAGTFNLGPYDSAGCPFLIQVVASKEGYIPATHYTGCDGETLYFKLNMK